MKVIPKINAKAINRSDISQTERALLYLIRDIQEKDRLIEAMVIADKERVKLLKQHQEKLRILRMTLRISPTKKGNRDG